MNESPSDETGKLTRTSIRQGNVQKANNIPRFLICCAAKNWPNCFIRKREGYIGAIWR